MPSLVAYNPNGKLENALQFGTIVMDVNGSVDLGSLNWCPGFGICNQYIIITDTYTRGKTNQANAQPMGFCTTDLTDASLISSINKLAASNSYGPFATLQDAITWALGQGYFIINQSYPSIITTGCVLNLDAGLPASYPLVLSNWYDLSGNGNTGTTNNNVTYSSSYYGNLVFNSANSDYISFSSTSNIPSGNTNYTISVWFNPTSIGDKGLVGWGNYGTTNEVNAFRLNSTGLINYWWANDLSVNVTLSANTWYNAVAKFDGTTREIWLNGSLLGSDNPVGHNVTTTSNLTIGKTYNTEYFDGSIGEVQIFDRSLSSSEVVQNYNALLPRYNGTYVDPCVTPIYPFVSVWRTTSSNESITLPYWSLGTFDGTVDWGDGNITSNTYAGRTHTYTNPGDYTVTIRGKVNGWAFQYTPSTNNEKIRSVIRWGSLKLAEYGQFINCSNLQLDTVSDVLDLSGVQQLGSMFLNCTSLTTINRVNEWNTSGVTDMSYMFQSSSFNQPTLSGWNVSNVMFMGSMFRFTPFNGDISNWDVSKVIFMNYTFANTSAFNQNIGNWNTSKVYDLSGAFQNATKFNQNINNWNISGVTSLAYTFNNASSFNQPLSGWNTSNVYNLDSTFNGASNFNQNINNWNVSAVTSMNSTFANAYSFNQPLSGWDVSNVTTLFYTFYSASSFNQNINNWNVSKVTDMSNTFSLARSFDQPLSGWNVSKVTTMVGTFEDANVFNQNINSWDVSNVTRMVSMFRNAYKFNQPLSGWNVTKVYDMSYMFWMDNFSTTSFNQPIENWNMSAVTSLTAMFYNNRTFNQPLSGWNVSNVTSTAFMFRTAVFDQDIGNWNVSKVQTMAAMFNSTFNNGGSPSISGWTTSSLVDMYAMFYANSSFNQPIGNWDTSKVQYMNATFFFSRGGFNQPLSGWNTSNVTTMNAMFQRSDAFNQNIGNWSVSAVTDFSNFMASKTNANYSSNNLDSIYNGWSTQNVKSNLSINFGTIKYSSSGAAGKAVLTGSPYNWVIVDGGQV